MPDIVVSTAVSTKQTPGAGFDVFVTPSGTIALSSDDAILAEGSNTVMVAGTIMVSDSFYYGVYATGLGVTVLVQPDGSISSAGASIVASAAGAVSIRNYGTITGGSTAISSSSNASESIFNAGYIRGDVFQGGGVDIFTHAGGEVLGQVSGGLDDDQLVFEHHRPGIAPLRYDGGSGTDRVNLTNFGRAIWLDLAYDGSQLWTRDDRDLASTNPWRAVADLTSVETIIGSQLSDMVWGDAGANTYQWTGNGERPDFFDGRGGTDTFQGQGFALWVDLTLQGGEVWTKSDNNVTVSTNSWRTIASLDNVEVIQGGSGSDAMYGDAGDNTLISNGIDYQQAFERFEGRGGSDTYDLSTTGFGGVWVDLAYGNHQVWGSLATFANGTNAQTPMADLVGVENIVGTLYSDEVYGDGSNNTYFFTGFNGTNKEAFDGRGGTDTFDGSRSNVALWINLLYGTEVFTNGSQAPITEANATIQLADLTSVENLVGSQYSDIVRGSGGDNRIAGGAGSDTLSGQGGNDVFVFRNSDGIDTITDFAAGTGLGDRLELSGFGTTYDTFAEVFATSSQVGADTHVLFGSIILKNVTRTSLVADDFLFV